jgi:N-acetylglutamate synthase-like GNAT family acetyltransferase
MTEITQLLTLSETDSNRFGLRIVRGNLDDTPELVTRILQDISDSAAEIAIFRVPAGSTRLLHRLHDYGFSPIHADTLVYHSRDLSERIPDEPAAMPWDIQLATASDSPGIAAVARQSFDSYRSHYHANPRLDPARIAEGYAEWAISFIKRSTPDLETWIARRDGQVIAFATCRLSPAEHDVEIVLNAVSPSEAGQGVYSSLLRHLLRAYQAQHFYRARISTQVWNYRVQRAWARAGFIITHAYNTYHLNIAPHAP